MKNQKGQASWGMVGGIILTLIVIALIAWVGWFRTVDEGETCVIVTLGRVTGYAPTGPSWKFRGTNRYFCFDSRNVMYQVAQNAEGSADFMDWPIGANTNDGQKVELTANVTFHIEPTDVEFVYSEVGQTMEEVKERVVANFTRSMVRNIVPNFEALDLYTSGRVRLEADLSDALAEMFASRGVTLDDFQLRSITFDADYAQVLENKQVALERVHIKEYEAQQAVYEAQRAAELAKGEANAAIERARGDAEAVVLAAQAEATAISLKGASLRENPEILQFEFIQNLATAQWLMLPSEGIIPFLPLDVLK